MNARLPQLSSELAVAESPDPRPGRKATPSSPADAARFDRFLRTARADELPVRTPAGSRPDARPVRERLDHLDPAQRSRAAARADDRREEVQRRDPADAGGRRSAAGDRDDADRAARADDRARHRADDRRLEDGDDDARRTEGGEAAERTREAGDDGTEDNGATGETTEAVVEGEPAAGTVEREVGLDGAPIELPGGAQAVLVSPAVEPDRVELPEEAATAGGELVHDVGEADGATGSPVDDDGAETDTAPVAVTDGDPSAPVAAAAAVLTDHDRVAAEHLAGTAAEGRGAGDAPSRATGGADGVDGSAATEAGGGAAPVDGPETVPADADPAAPSAADADSAAPSAADADSAERPSPANVTARSADRSAPTPAVTTAAIDAASAGARRGPAPVTAPAGTTGAGSLVEGEPGEPLWLQVHRAVGSLRTLRNGEQQVSIRLRPAELGSVMVRINAGEHGTTVSLLTESAVATNQLNQQRQLLIDQLEQGGLRGVAVDVGTGGGPDQGGEESPDAGADPTSSDRTGATAAGGSGGAAGRIGPRGRRVGVSSAGLVDLDL